MSTSEVPLLSFETPSLYLLSQLLDPEGLSGDIFVPSEFGVLRFTHMDLMQERGRIPQLIIDFELEDGKFRVAYFGHVSPFKLHSVELDREGETAQQHVFSEGSEVCLPLKACDSVTELPSGLDWKIVGGSLFLWRSCLGLPNACDESLSKYFSKMKSVSRYQWTCESYARQGEDILEKWSASVSCNDGDNLKISIFLVDGLVSKIEF
ncbi:hypothetical protein [Maridesulfovibrio sp.]|uniref:hypothetical protein n=1 Tax=unclassified Maridesulfovibrio TaxID=2794999 RepID=UPI003AFFB16C